MKRNLDEILTRIDALLADGKISEAENFMITEIEKAESERDYEIQIALYNEIAGFYRVSGNKEKCFDAIERALLIQDKHGYAGSLAYATTLLNKATALVAYGYVEEALSIYERVKAHYDLNIQEPDYRVASLHNNMSSALLKIGMIDEGESYLEASMNILKQLVNSEIEQATCSTNIALIKISKGDVNEAEEYLEKAISIFEEQGVTDVHYDAAIAAFGNLRFKEGRYEEAAMYYENAAKGTEEKFGHNHNYILLSKNCAKAWHCAGNAEKADYYDREAEKGQSVC